MKPETEAKIARRIGMTEEVHTDGRLLASWWDGEDTGMRADDLTRYLATGDRPLRVLEAMCDNETHADLFNCSPGKWQVRVYTGPVRRGPVMDTPAAAILACAAAIEGEGHE